MCVYKVYNEDCITTMEKLHKLGGKVDVVLTSPPYNTSKKRGTWSKEQKYHYDIKSVDAMTDIQYIEWTVELFKHYNNILKPNGTILYNISYSTDKPYLMYEAIYKVMEQTDFAIADTIIWKKSNALPNNMSKNRMTRICEFVFVFARKSEFKTFNMNKEILSIRDNGIKQYTTYYNFVEAKNNDKSCKLNKATYSSELCEKLLSMYARENSIIYDSFNGTGTTGVACVKLGHSYIGSEISKEQCEYSIQRIQETKEVICNV